MPTWRVGPLSAPPGRTLSSPGACVTPARQPVVGRVAFRPVRSVSWALTVALTVSLGPPPCVAARRRRGLFAGATPTHLGVKRFRGLARSGDAPVRRPWHLTRVPAGPYRAPLTRVRSMSHQGAGKVSCCTRQAPRTRRQARHSVPGCARWSEKASVLICFPTPGAVDGFQETPRQVGGGGHAPHGAQDTRRVPHGVLKGRYGG